MLKRQWGAPLEVEITNLMYLAREFKTDIDKLLKMNTTRLDIYLEELHKMYKREADAWKGSGTTAKTFR